MKNLQGAELKLAELQAKYSGMEKQNFELSEKVNMSTTSLINSTNRFPFLDLPRAAIISDNN